MTKDEFREYVTKVINTESPFSNAAIDKITEQWESDVNDARIDGQTAQSIYMEGDTSMRTCMGPCCGGSI